MNTVSTLTATATATESTIPARSSARAAFDDYLAKLHSDQAARIERIGRFEDVAIVRHQKDENRWQMILRDVSGGDAWRTQSFDRKGFYSHMVFKNKAEAIKDAAQHGFTIRDDGILDRLQDTPEFQEGLFMVEQMTLLNSGRINFSEFNTRMHNYRNEAASTA